ncbi:SH3 domain-containing protein [Urbifossiella limnaea]|uniref:SH3 domain-containing protein n=1 Tax=Urbifossiella limnaea TaxID=2528023 RepID=A0A517XX85_9BACT|nr:SH3 domain-containing protein [Urbifossiella limnaea]QDU22095.1 hypothetical protein ETAA1_40700 [Urbifossiella limnaea]
MRRAALAGFVLAALPASAVAQTLPYRAVVADPEVTLYAGPSDRFPNTGRLARGTELVVHEDAGNGWVAVQAPRSVSWVPMALVDYDPSRKAPQDVTTQAEVTLAPGKVGLAQPLAEVRRVSVPAGTILTVIGDKAAFDGKSWYPVLPVPGDYRYVPKSAVHAAGPANTSFVVRDTAPPGLPAVTPPASSGVLPAAAVGTEPASKAGSNHPLWAQADAAEKDGRFEDAERLFFQLARLMNEPNGDHDLANLCYTRIHGIRERRRTGSTGVTAPAVSIPGPGRATDLPKEDRPTLLPPVGNTGKAPPPAVTPQPKDSAADAAPRWSGVGMLTRSALALDGRRTYALESSPGVVRTYVVGGPGVDLDRYANRRVDVYGATLTRRDLSKPYIVATDVNPNP